jgi:hypothetical protein
MRRACGALVDVVVDFGGGLAVIRPEDASDLQDELALV